MMVCEFDQVELDLCGECGGIWLDAGELELLFGDRRILDGFLTSGDGAAARGEAPRRCPICRARMVKRVTAGDTPVVYDVCPHGDGLWFDRGELAAVLHMGSSDPRESQVVAWLREMFPEARAQAEGHGSTARE